MKTAIISDIHGNYQALLAVLKDIEQCKCDRVICLGDMVEGGDENESVVHYLYDHKIPTILGNHDYTSDVELSKEMRNYLSTLPESIIEQDILYTHISPRQRQRKIKDAIEAWNVFDETSYRLIFIGHVHIPLIFAEKSEEFGTATCYPVVHNTTFTLDHQERYIICVGAVGYSRDRIALARYGIYDHIKHSVEIRAVNAPLLPF